MSDVRFQDFHSEPHIALSRLVNFRAVISSAIVFAVSIIAHGETATTNVVEGGYINYGGQYVLGETGPFNFLLIRNEGWLESTSGVIGYDPGADSNVAWVTGANSLWDNRGTLRIGALGSRNGLVITNGGRVDLYTGIVGEEQTSSSNRVTVISSGSRWNSRALQLGLSGYSNVFVVAQGALATSSGFYDAVGYNEPSYGNRMEIDGTGSSFAGYNLAVGSFGSSGNELIIRSGGQISTVNGFVGNGSSNRVTITGAGSRWHNAAVFFHGNDGIGNGMLITNGGQLFCEGGYISGGNNTVVITGANSLWETGGENGQLVVGDYGSSNYVHVINGGRVNSWAGYIPGDDNRVALSGPGTLWQNVQGLTVGEDFGHNNAVSISNQARINTGHLTLAADFGNVTVGGASTILDVSGSLSVGDELGRGNQLTVASGGRVTNSIGYLGGTASAFLFGGNTGNRALITGTGSVWINRSNLTIGVTGSETELAVRNGGRVSNRTGYLGFYSYSRNNRVVVSDPGSLWENDGDIYVGYTSSGNTMVVGNQGRVQSGSGWVGRERSETNSVLISGTNSVWNMTGGLFVGNSGSGNRVTVASGGNLFSEAGTIDSPNGRSNSVVVSGPGSRWTVNSFLSVGPGSSLNHLRIDGGGTVIAAGMSVGNTGPSISNTVTVVDGRLVVTNSTRTGTLTVREGALFLTSTDLLVNRLQTLSGALSLISVLSGNASVRTLDLSAGSTVRIGDGQNAARWQLGATTHGFGSGLVIASNSSLAVAGGASGSITNSGLLEVGTNIAGFNLAGSLIQTRSGSLAFDVGGTLQRTGYDYIQLDGAAQFDGILRLRLANGFVPSSNSVFTLLTAQTTGGSFINAPSGARLTFEGTAVSCQVQYSGTTLRLSNFQNAGPAGTNDIEDAWAIRYFGHSPLTEQEREADNDGDGLSTYEEYRAGTNPLDAQSALRILSVGRSLQGAVLQFSAVPDRTYGIEFSTNFEDWQEVPAPLFTAPAPTVLQWIDDGALTAPLNGAVRSYRVLVR